MSKKKLLDHDLKPGDRVRVWSREKGFPSNRTVGEVGYITDVYDDAPDYSISIRWMDGGTDDGLYGRQFRVIEPIEQVIAKDHLDYYQAITGE